MTDSNTPLTEDEEMTFSSGVAAFESKHFAQAMKLLSPLAEKNAQAQHMLAIMFQNGLGTVENPMQP